jgi:hypothetical protein
MYKYTPHYDIELVRKLLKADKYHIRSKAEEYILCEIGAAIQEACDIISRAKPGEFQHSECSKKVKPHGHWMDVYKVTDATYGELYIKFMVPNDASVYIVSLWFWDDSED